LKKQSLSLLKDKGIKEEYEMETIYFSAAFFICLVGYIVHTVMHFAEYGGKRTATSKKLVIISTIVIIFGFVGYGFMIYFDPVEIGLSKSITLTLGMLFGITGFTMFMLTLSSSIAKKGFVERELLYTKGIYSRIRNPMYLGVMLLHLGVPLVFNSLLTFISAIIWIPILFSWKRAEENDLEKRFGEE
jgi:protein-S-isoprenylcysteine O-methyltransferase Ste14